MILRPPLMADASLIKTWRPNLGHVSMSDHQQWFAKYVAGQPWRKMLFAEVDGQTVGMVHLDSGDEGTSWEISYIVAPECRRKGYGVHMLKLAVEEWKVPLDHVKARIQANNFASIHCALKVGVGVELLKCE